MKAGKNLKANYFPMIKVTTQIMIDELERRGVPVEVVTEEPFMVLRYFYQGSWHMLRSVVPESTTATGKMICDEKRVAAAVAKQCSVPVPDAMTYTTMKEALDFMARHDQVVVKPVDGGHGNAVTVGITTEPKLAEAIMLAIESSKKGEALLQQRVAGHDLRVLIIGGYFAAATRRVPAGVTGDGVSTIRQLIERENETNPDRGENDEKRLAKIDIEVSERYLGEKLDNEVPADGEEVTVVGVSNIGAGGMSVDYTDQVPADMIADAERFARTVRVAACGVDFMWDRETGEYYFIEANTSPGMYSMHLHPGEGPGQPVDKLFVDMLLGDTPLAWEVQTANEQGQ